MQEPDTPLVNDVVILCKHAALLGLGHDFCLFEDFQALNVVNCIHRQVILRDSHQIVRDRYLTSYDGFQLGVKFESLFK